MGSRIQVKGMEAKTLESSNPGILEPYFLFKAKFSGLEIRESN